LQSDSPRNEDISSSKPIHLEVFKPQARWEREDDPRGSNKFTAYDPDQILQIELAYLTNRGTLEVTGDKDMVKNGYRYIIDFDRMIQLNFTLNSERKVRR
jgi:hypothetical protein